MKFIDVLFPNKEDTEVYRWNDDFSDYFDTWTESTCRDRIKKFISGEKTLTGLLGPTIPANTEQPSCCSVSAFI